MRTPSIACAHRRFVLGITLAFVGLDVPGRADAIGTVDLSWDACAPIVSERVRDGAHPYSLYASVLGHDVPHTAYQVFVRVERVIPVQGPFLPYPDAWRFDATGCQTSSLIRVDHLAPSAVSKTCPSFSSSPALQIKDFGYDALSGRARAILANSYPSGSPTTTNPLQRYFLARFEFDHTFSVVGPGTPGEPGFPAETCGGFEADMRLRILAADWLDVTGGQHAWNFTPTGVTFCGSCTPTPATNATWGQIKGQYRR